MFLLIRPRHLPPPRPGPFSLGCTSSSSGNHFLDDPEQFCSIFPPALGTFAIFSTTVVVAPLLQIPVQTKSVGSIFVASLMPALSIYTITLVAVSIFFTLRQKKNRQKNREKKGKRTNNRSATTQ